MSCFDSVWTCTDTHLCWQRRHGEMERRGSPDGFWLGEADNMCDIFALSSGVNYTAQEYLPIFAEKSRNNMNGWGIGFFRDNIALVEKSSEQVYDQEQVHESFQRLARVIDSRIIVSHISCPLSGGRHTAHNHPFSLSFLDHVWLFVHVGLIDEIEKYQTTNEPRIDVDVYPARVFEYLRDQLISYLRYTPYGSLGRSLVKSIRNMLSQYPGRYAFFARPRRGMADNRKKRRATRAATKGMHVGNPRYRIIVSVYGDFRRSEQPLKSPFRAVTQRNLNQM